MVCRIWQRHVGPGRFIHYGLHFLFPVLYTIRFERRLAVGLQIKRYMVGYDTRQPSRLYAVFIVQNRDFPEGISILPPDENQRCPWRAYDRSSMFLVAFILAHKSFTGKRYVFGP